PWACSKAAEDYRAGFEVPTALRQCPRSRRPYRLCKPGLQTGFERLLGKIAGMNEADIKAYGQSWYAATKVDDPLRPRLSVDLDMDACVIGGGLAGLTAARELAKAGWSVVLLEANRIASGASGRNTGFVLPGFAADTDKLIERVGFERTRSLWALAQAGVD